MRKNWFPKALVLASLIVLLSATVSGTAFSVDQPDGTADNTSGYYTIEWTPFVDPAEVTRSMAKDLNSISCYADLASSGYTKDQTIIEGYACCDTNEARIDVFGWPGRKEEAQYYVWCINDNNSDMNAYSAGALTISRFQPSNVGALGIDSVGGILAGIARNATAIGSIIVIVIILVFLTDLLTNVFGIFTFFKSMLGNNR